MSRAVLGRASVDDGTVEAIVPGNLTEPEFDADCDANEGDQLLKERFTELLPTGTWTVVGEDLGVISSRSWRGPGAPLRIEDAVYWIRKFEGADWSYLPQYVRSSTSLFPSSAFVFDALAFDGLWSDGDPFPFEAAVAQLQAIVVDAFDGDGYVLWRPPPER